MRLEGLSKAGGEIGFVVSQRAIKGGEPTLREIDNYLIKRGYQKVGAAALVGDHIADKTWWNQNEGYVVTDVKTANFKKTSNGKIVPIDLIVIHATKGSDLHKILATGGAF